jgi:hypothetical protein
MLYLKKTIGENEKIRLAWIHKYVKILRMGGAMCVSEFTNRNSASDRITAMLEDTDTAFGIRSASKNGVGARRHW